MRTRHQNNFERFLKWLNVLLVILGAPLLQAQTNAISPANDSYTNAFVITGTDFQLDVDLSNATAEPSEPTWRFGYAQSLWWSWSAPEGGIYNWSSELSSNWTAVDVYETQGTNRFSPVVTTHWRYLADQAIYPEKSGTFRAQAGRQYLIRLQPAIAGIPSVFGKNHTQSDVPYPVSARFQKSADPVPANDNFTNRIVLTGTNAIFTALLSSATIEPNEPQVAPEALNHTLWWTWTAPGYGSATIRKHDTNPAAAVGIYIQGESQAPSLVAASVSQFGNGCIQEWDANDSVTWHTVPGVHYEIQVDRFAQLIAESAFELQLEFTPAPTNDVPSGAILLEISDLIQNISNSNSTLRPGEPTIPGQSGSNSVWFKWIAPADGILEAANFTLANPNIPGSSGYQSWGNQPGTQPGGGQPGDPGLPVNRPPTFPCGGFGELYPKPGFVPVFGLFTSLLPAGLNPDTLVTSGTNGVIANVVAGKQYWLQLDGAAGTSGRTYLNTLFLPRPSNDNFNNRIRLGSESLKVSGSTFAATAEATDPAYSATNALMSRSVWWEWKIPTSGRWTLMVNRQTLDSKFVVFKGTNINSLIEVTNTVYESVLFEGHAGDVFQIGVFALSNLGGYLEFSLAPLAAPSLRTTWNQEYPALGYRQLQFQFPDNSGLPYLLERSDDLLFWTPIITNANAMSHTVDVQSDLAKPQEFFRTRLWTPTTA